MVSLSYHSSSRNNVNSSKMVKITLTRISLAMVALTNDLDAELLMGLTLINDLDAELLMGLTLSDDIDADDAVDLDQ